MIFARSTAAMSPLVVMPMVAALTSGASTQLTRGSGNDTEAAWAPDGKRIAFQTDRNGDLDIALLDLQTGGTALLVSGPGHACFPAWSPDGRWIAYSFAHFTRTAVQGLENGYNIYIVPAAGGTPRQLTSGLQRDYCPTFTRDGRRILFSSTRGTEKSAVSLYSVPFEGGEPQPVMQHDATDVAAVQPDLSPDGRLLAFGYIAGFRSNWGLRLAKWTNISDVYPLTELDTPYYGPRWSPDGRLLACTGYQNGDQGWRVYLVELTSGRRFALDTGPGNSRSPAWSPDGQDIVFENNGSGQYKLFRVPVPELPTARTAAEAAAKPPVVHFSFQQQPKNQATDLSGRGNEGRIVGTPTWQNGALSFGPESYITVAEPQDLAFGSGPFSIQATILVEQHTDDLRMIAIGDYPGNRRGWQLFIGKDNHAHFNSRDRDLKYRGAVSDAPLPTGRQLTLVGMRTDKGFVRLYVAGLPQARTSGGATVEYGTPTQLRIGAQFDGTAPFVGARLYEVSVYGRALSSQEARSDSLTQFLRR